MKGYLLDVAFEIVDDKFYLVEDRHLLIDFGLQLVYVLAHDEVVVQTLGFQLA
jgi:hypothetical protein